MFLNDFLFYKKKFYFLVSKQTEIAYMHLYILLWIRNRFSFLASIGRAQTLGANNVTFPNGTVDESAIKEQTKDLFQQIPCSTDVRLLF